jgi:hypothetical protein
MQPADDVTYSGETAAVYDTWFGGYLGGTAIVDRLVALAGDGGPGPVLELGIGTGRVALPLAERGVDVHGSEAMVAQLRPGGLFAFDSLVPTPAAAQAGRTCA